MLKDRSSIGHVCMLSASVLWGLMAPFGKHAMSSGITGLTMVTFRVVGGAVLFWIASLFVRSERVPRADLFRLFLAALTGLVGSQCCYTLGLSLTSPVNATIAVTTLPIFTLLLSIVLLRQRVLWRKILGVVLGCAGAVLLITASASGGKSGNIWGDLLCLTAQFSFSFYLILFSPLLKKYSLFTVSKWMFLFSALVILPFSWSHLAALPWQHIDPLTWAESAYMVLIGTFVCYMLVMLGQQRLPPTVVSIYNYAQPVVAIVVSLVMGIGVFGLRQAFATALVFVGVWFVMSNE